MPRLEKIKRPGGVLAADLVDLGRDDDGVWLFAPAGTRWAAPHQDTVFPWDVLVLLDEGRPWVTWWIDNPTRPCLEIDVCLPVRRTEDDGWSYVDLELDPLRMADGTVEIDDEDEFATACRQGWIPEADARLARTTADRMAEVLRSHEEPWGARGWQRLASARRSAEPT